MIYLLNVARTGIPRQVLYSTHQAHITLIIFFVFNSTDHFLNTTMVLIFATGLLPTYVFELYLVPVSHIRLIHQGLFHICAHFGEKHGEQVADLTDEDPVQTGDDVLRCERGVVDVIALAIFR